MNFKLFIPIYLKQILLSRLDNYIKEKKSISNDLQSTIYIFLRKNVHYYSKTSKCSLFYRIEYYYFLQFKLTQTLKTLNLLHNLFYLN